MISLEERVELLKNECTKLDAALHVKYEELKREGASEQEKGLFVDYVNEVQKVFFNVNVKNVKELELVISEMERDLKDLYGDEIVSNVYAVPEKTEKVVTKKQKKDDYGRGMAAGAALVVLGGALGYVVSERSKLPVQASVIDSRNLETVTETETNIPNANLSDSDTVIIESTEKEEVVETTVPASTDETLVVSEDTQEVASVEEIVTLVLGEPGTFLDVTDDEQVMARAQYIYDNYYAKFIDKLSNNEKSFITVERIANTIRVVNGHCPEDENGYKFMDANTTDTYCQSFVELFANIPSSDVMGTVELVPAHLFAIDGSETQEFLRTYDELYQRLAEGRNERNSDKYRGAAEILEAKMYYEWHCQGMGGNILFNTETHEIEIENNIRFNQSTGNWERLCPEDGQYKPLINTEVYPISNPHNIDATYRYFAYMGSMYRFGSYIEEGELNQMAPICVQLCVDFESNELNIYSIDEVYTGINEGVWNNIIAKHAGMDEQAPGIPFSIGFWEALNDQLEYDYTHSNTLKLN